jgi:hypothetical protein
MAFLNLNDPHIGDPAPQERSHQVAVTPAGKEPLLARLNALPDGLQGGLVHSGGPEATGFRSTAFDADKAVLKIDIRNAGSDQLPYSAAQVVEAEEDKTVSSRGYRKEGFYSHTRLPIHGRLHLLRMLRRKLKQIVALSGPIRIAFKEIFDTLRSCALAFERGPNGLVAISSLPKIKKLMPFTSLLPLYFGIFHLLFFDIILDSHLIDRQIQYQGLIHAEAQCGIPTFLDCTLDGKELINGKYRICSAIPQHLTMRFGYAFR